jgi:hypothetical protein
MVNAATEEWLTRLWTQHPSRPVTTGPDLAAPHSRRDLTLSPPPGARRSIVFHVDQRVVCV